MSNMKFMGGSQLSTCNVWQLSDQKVEVSSKIQ